MFPIVYMYHSNLSFSAEQNDAIASSPGCNIHVHVVCLDMKAGLVDCIWFRIRHLAVSFLFLRVMSSVLRSSLPVLLGIGASLAVGACVLALKRYSNAIDVKLNNLYGTIERLNLEIHDLHAHIDKLVSLMFGKWLYHVNSIAYDGACLFTQNEFNDAWKRWNLLWNADTFVLLYLYSLCNRYCDSWF